MFGGSMNNESSGSTILVKGVAVPKILPSPLPHSPALLHQPQTCNIFQKPNRAAHAALIREIRCAHFLIDERRRQLSSH
jgi:hypothetical protein